jgi:hypothetical protein
MRLTTGCFCFYFCLLLASCSSSPDNRKPVTEFSEPGKPPSGVCGISFDDDYATAQSRAAAIAGGDHVTCPDDNQVRVEGKFWGCRGEARLLFSGGRQSINSAVITVDAAPGKMLEILAHELMPGEPYLFRRAEESAVWHWSSASQALFDIELRAADDKGASSRIEFTRVRRDVETTGTRTSSRPHGGYRNLNLDNTRPDNSDLERRFDK